MVQNDYDDLYKQPPMYPRHVSILYDYNTALISQTYAST